jgi:SPP1 family predicted phage head-tail adaptor
MLPRKLSTNVRYLSASQLNTLISIIQPNAGQAADGTPLPPTTVGTTHANVAQWRGKELDKPQSREGQSSYKIIIRYPKAYSIDSGMQIMVRGQLHNIESISDPDGQMVELHIWTFVDNDVTGMPTW